MVRDSVRVKVPFTSQLQQKVAHNIRPYLWITHNEYLPLGQILTRSHQSGNNRTPPLCAAEPRMGAKAPSLGFSGRGDCCQCLGLGRGV